MTDNSVDVLIKEIEQLPVKIEGLPFEQMEKWFEWNMQFPKFKEAFHKYMTKEYNKIRGTANYCHACGGSGEVYDDQSTSFHSVCGVCGGSGWYYK